MSLVILSSQQEFNETDVSEAIENPSAFQNYFTKPVEVPPDSEVSVVSVKINRSQNFDISPESRINIYLGTELGEGQEIDEYSTSNPIKIDLFNNDRSSLAPADFRQRLEDKLNKAPLHPDYYGRVNVSLALDATTKALEGFNIEYSKASNGSANSSQVGSTWTAFSDESVGNATIATLNTYGKRITNSQGGSLGNFCTVVGTDYPLAPSGGEFIFSPKDRENNSGTTWAVGLARPLQLVGNPNNLDTQLHQDVYPRWHEDDGNPNGVSGFYDFMVYKDEDDDIIRVYQSLGSDLQGTTQLTEVDFEDNASNSSYTEPINMTDIRRFKFILKNELLELWGFDLNEGTPGGAVLTVSLDSTGTDYTPGTYSNVATTGGSGTGLTLDITVSGGGVITSVAVNTSGTGYTVSDVIVPDAGIIGEGDGLVITVASVSASTDGAYKLICRANDPTASYNEKFKKVGQNQWGLYPIVELNATDDHINVDKFNGALKSDGTSFDFYNDIYFSYTYPKEIEGNPADTYWLDIAYEYNLYEKVDAFINTPYKSLLTSGGFEVVDKNVVMILDKSNQYLRLKWDKFQPDIRSFLGFDVAIVTQSDYGTVTDNNKKITFTSNTVPLPRSTRECFVKLESLNIESFNGATSDISKIIYSIPRFDNSGAVVGSLFFENNDRYYLKLNNVAPILLNRMDVQMVDVRNRIIDGLFGNTVVILHIRKSS